jgi:tRNA (mo5U34)-methyltransferase
MSREPEPPPPDSFRDWVRSQVEIERYWFQRMELAPGLVTPGWSDPRVDKLPYFGLPERMEGMRVLDVGCAEGFFSFEAERRGAREVVAVDCWPDSVRRFQICRAALGSRATVHLGNVYDLDPRSFGTFDLVLFFGVLYHLRNPLLALEPVRGVCAGRLLLQTATREVPGAADVPLATFQPRGVESGRPEAPMHDPTVFWLPNAECARAMTAHVGFEDVETVSSGAGLVLRARSPERARGERADESKAPWS